MGGDIHREHFVIPETLPFKIVSEDKECKDYEDSGERDYSMVTQEARL
jgi:hypothetical protein